MSASPPPGVASEDYQNELNGNDVGRSRSATPSDEKKNGRSRSYSKSASRSRSKSRSPKRSRYSRSPSDDRRKRRTRSRSRSRGKRYSRSRSRSRGRHSKSRSPGPYRGGRMDDGRLDPVPSKTLGVFGLSYQTDERELEYEFERFGRVEHVKLVRDPSGMSRGFGFITYGHLSDAKEARDAMKSVKLSGRYIRVDYSITAGPHNRTPGHYQGSRQRFGGYYSQFERRSDDKRGSRGSRRRSRSYSRSRSRSPRRSRY